MDELNSYFADAGTGLRDLSVDGWSEGNPERGGFDDSKFYFKYVGPGMILKSLRGGSNAVGLDGISYRLIQMTLPYVLPVIEHLFNFSLTYGVVPAIWKSAVIVPIPKISHPTLVEHRLISILPFLSKMLERIVFDQLTEYLRDNDLLDPCQFAYRRNSSTQICIMRMLDDIRLAADRRKVTISIFFDFSKAFDRVRHGILLKKLKEMELSDFPLDWIASYLSGRMQAVRDGFNGTTSSPACIIAGVPQGSVLGPLLFTLYVADICKELQYCKHNFYADDLHIYYHREPSDLPSGLQKMNYDIGSIVQWATNQGLMLNSFKTQAIVFGTARFVNSINLDLLPAINIKEQTKLSTSIKYLGVTITNNLSWNPHVQNVIKRVRTKLYQLKLTKHLLPNEFRLRLIVSLVFPHLDYCCAALTDITEQQNTQLYRAINACIRFAADVRWREHVTSQYRKFRLLKIEARRKYFIAYQLFNIICTQEPRIIYDEFTFKSATALRGTRASRDPTLSALVQNGDIQTLLQIQCVQTLE